MPKLTIKINAALYAELAEAARDGYDTPLTPDAWASEAVESALASRRLPRFAKAPGNSGRASTPVEHRVVSEGLRRRLLL